MMRQGSNSGRRPRGRTNRKQHGGGGGQSRTHTFDSNGPDGRVRGNARQVYEKYLTLARDATSAGDRVAAEAYYQHAEHYFRILSDSTDPQPGGRRQEERQPQSGGDGSSYEGDEPAAAANGNAVAPAKNAPQADHDNDATPAEAPQAQTKAVTPQVNGQGADSETPQRPRRGRPRKPRKDDEGASKNEAATETEDGTAAG